MRNMRRLIVDMDSPVEFAAESHDAPLAMPTRISIAKADDPRETSDSRHSPRPAFRAWPEIRARLRAAGHGAVLLDFDGTLVKLRRRPSDVRMPAQAKRVLQCLVNHSGLFVAIVSGRRVETLRSLFDVKGLHYFGLHGAERDGKSATLSEHARVALEGAKRAAQLEFGAVAGIWIEDKGLSFSVHHRDAKAVASKQGEMALGKLLAPWGDALHVLNGSRVWEVLPAEIPGKASAIGEVLRELPVDTVVVYIGDDSTDETAFAALPNQITVRVGREPGSCARYFVRGPADVLRLLARMEEELP
jgi:trehalose 6-phosphate phosphatase